MFSLLNIQWYTESVFEDFIGYVYSLVVNYYYFQNGYIIFLPYRGTNPIYWEAYFIKMVLPCFWKRDLLLKERMRCHWEQIISF